MKAIWPERPYKGLNSYGPDDRILFTGREADVRACAKLLATASVKLLLLHGKTGCGKSSFLRAGLIPLLETEGLGDIRFFDEKGQAVFIRCTDSPIDRLSEALSAFFTSRQRVRTPGGDKDLDLRVGFPDFHALGSSNVSHDIVLSALVYLAKRLPSTLVFIIDQAEEVITLNRQSGGDSNRCQFFTFLQDFVEAEVDVKLVLSLRTEFFGRFLSAMDAMPTLLSQKTVQFELSELGYDDLVHAITTPTSTESVSSLGPPVDHYRFNYAPELPQRIARDLMHSQQSGGFLPLMQIVCSRLHGSLADDGSVRTITHVQYETHGEIEGMVFAHVEESIGRALSEAQHDSLINASQVDVHRWLTSLASLSFSEPDGTVTSRAITRETLADILAENGWSSQATDLVISVLLSPDAAVLRRTSPPRTTETLALGHDAIALALQRWSSFQGERDKYRRVATRIRRNALITVLAVTLGFVSYSLVSWVNRRGEQRGLTKAEIDRVLDLAMDSEREDYSLALLLARHAEVLTQRYGVEPKENAAVNALRRFLEVAPSGLVRFPSPARGILVGRDKLFVVSDSSDLEETKVLGFLLEPPEWTPLPLQQPQANGDEEDRSFLLFSFQRQRYDPLFDETGKTILLVDRFTGKTQLKSGGDFIFPDVFEPNVPFSFERIRGFGWGYLAQYRPRRERFPMRIAQVHGEKRVLNIDVLDTTLDSLELTGNRDAIALITATQTMAKLSFITWRDDERKQIATFTAPLVQAQVTEDRLPAAPLREMFAVHAFAPDDSSFAFRNTHERAYYVYRITQPQPNPSTRVDTRIWGDDERPPLAVGPATAGSPIAYINGSDTITVFYPWRAKRNSFELPRFGGPITALQFTFDGSTLVALANQRLAYWSLDSVETHKDSLHTLSSVELRREACRAASRDLSTDEVRKYKLEEFESCD